MLNAAIVGLGWWGKTIVDAVQGKSDRIRFVAAQTRTRTRGEPFCEERHLQLRDDLDDVLGDPEIDAVVYATPHSRHEEHVTRAAAAGKHVFVEKPFTLTVASARRALEAVKKAGVVLGIDFQRRFHPSIGEIRERVRDGRLGAICCAVGEAMAPAGLFLPKDSWRIDPEETPAGAMTGLGVHLVDGFIDLFGEIDEVHCTNARRAADLVDDTTVVQMRHRSGLLSTAVCSLATALNYRVAVYGSKGLAEASGPTLDGFRFLPAPVAPGAAAEPESVQHVGFNPLKAALEAFADAVRSGSSFPVPSGEIVHGVAVFEAIVSSVHAGRPVKVG